MGSRKVSLKGSKEEQPNFFTWHAAAILLLQKGPTVQHVNIVSNRINHLGTFAFFSPTAFNIWMFGQLLHITIRSEYKSIHASAIDCHGALLDLLHDNNIKMFHCILQCYFLALDGKVPQQSMLHCYINWVLGSSEEKVQNPLSYNPLR